MCRESSRQRAARSRLIGPATEALDSERNIVVEIVPPAASAGAGRRGAALHGGGAAEIAAAAHLARLLVIVPARAALAAIEDREVAPEALDHDLGRVLLLAGLIRPFAGLKLALDVNLRALLQVLLGDPGEVLVEDHD